MTKQAVLSKHHPQNHLLSRAESPDWHTFVTLFEKTLFKKKNTFSLISQVEKCSIKGEATRFPNPVPHPVISLRDGKPDITSDTASFPEFLHCLFNGVNYFPLGHFPIALIHILLTDTNGTVRAHCAQGHDHMA